MGKGLDEGYDCGFAAEKAVGTELIEPLQDGNVGYALLNHKCAYEGGKSAPKIKLPLILAVVIISSLSGFLSAFFLLKSGLVSDDIYAAAESQNIYPFISLLAENESDIIIASQKAAASVVEISTETIKYNPFFGQYVTQGAGSGIVLTNDGYIATNNHVIANASAITVRFNNGASYKAALIGADGQTDLAVLKISAAGLTPVSFADSSAIQVGQIAIAIGNPLGELGGTVTEGIISARERSIFIEDSSMTLIQTSAAINPGNSGGGLFDKSGFLVGLVNAKSSGLGIEGLGFAIPANTVKSVADEIIKNGYVSGRPQLGITVEYISAPRGKYTEAGVYIIAAQKNNGLVIGDKIISINGKAINSAAEIGEIISKFKAGEKITVKVKRQGVIKDISVTLAEKTALAEENSYPAL